MVSALKLVAYELSDDKALELLEKLWTAADRDLYDHTKNLAAYKDFKPDAVKIEVDARFKLKWAVEAVHQSVKDLGAPSKHHVLDALEKAYKIERLGAMHFTLKMIHKNQTVESL